MEDLGKLLSTLDDKELLERLHVAAEFAKLYGRTPELEAVEKELGRRPALAQQVNKRGVSR